MFKDLKYGKNSIESSLLKSNVISKVLSSFTQYVLRPVSS